MDERGKLEKEREILYRSYMQALLNGSEGEVREASERLDEIEEKIKKLGDT